MLSESVLSWLSIPHVAGRCMAVFWCAAAAIGQGGSANYAFVVGAGFLCDAGDSAPCPAVVKSADGSSYEMSGAGTFAAQSKSVTAAGTFTHKSASGNVLETGIWTAGELVRFESYGIAPGALLREGQAFGLRRFGAMHSRMFSGSMPAGGLAVFRIRLLPMRGVSRTATLEVNCALGKVPDERLTEGIRLAFEAGGVEFAEEVSGRTVFLLTRPAASTTPEAPPREVNANPTPAEVRP